MRLIAALALLALLPAAHAKQPGLAGVSDEVSEGAGASDWASIRAIRDDGNILAASRLAGHANPRRTMRVYAHAFDHDMLSGVQALAEHLDRSVGESFDELFSEDE
ncbi:hypothetical protein [Engelhardtia mirabilis]|uniref:Phage integrase family protein n=1 Tax=Engelhardtia mirabilis TaxID=2528011 RepID=A0A518BH61_9BACT|nr:hypothetical protein Pla133_13910 [Planctomycetes bacterium Pla133]QDV00647.1 hypothetical protein Pla86_13900 [Planctomycetes bacterium Pla86]